MKRSNINTRFNHRMMEVCFAGAKEKVIENLIKNLFCVKIERANIGTKKRDKKDRPKLKWSAHGTVERFKEAL